jgi:hypothetical protein
MFLGTLVYAVLLGLSSAGSSFNASTSPSLVESPNPPSVPTLPFPPIHVPVAH